MTAPGRAEASNKASANVQNISVPRWLIGWREKVKPEACGCGSRKSTQGLDTKVKNE